MRIDGRSAGLGVVDETLTPGTHLLEVSADGFDPFRRSFEAVPGQRVTVHAALSARSVFESPWFWAGIGAVVAGAGATTYLLVR